MNTLINSDTPKKDPKKIIYGILIAALILTWGYIFYDKSNSAKTISGLETKISTVDSARLSIQQSFMDIASKADSLTQGNLQLTGELADKNNSIQKLKNNIGNILKKNNATALELNEAKIMIGELNSKVEGLFSEINQLKGQNNLLTSTNEQLNTEKKQLTTDKAGLEESLNKTSIEKNKLEEKVDIASTLHASNIGISAINLKNSGKESFTNTAKRADFIRVSFHIDENRITPSGTKEFYVIVTGPDGKIVSEGTTFNTREEGPRIYTSKLSVNYEQYKMIPVSFDWKQKELFKEGEYLIEIYNNGFKIGHNTKILKKGGLFS